MPSKNETRHAVAFKCDLPVYEALVRLATKEHQTLSGFLRKILTRFVEENA